MNIGEFCIPSVYFGGLVVCVFAWIGLLACLAKKNTQGWSDRDMAIFYFGLLVAGLWPISLPITVIVAFFSIDSVKNRG